MVASKWPLQRQEVPFEDTRWNRKAAARRSASSGPLAQALLMMMSAGVAVCWLFSLMAACSDG